MKKVFFENDNNIELLLPNTAEHCNFESRKNSEPLFRKLISVLINYNYINGGNFIDAGCWIGDNALPWSKMTNGNIYAIDPSEKNCEFAKEIASLNDINNITFITGALSDFKKDLYTSGELSHCSLSEDEIGHNVINAFSIDELYKDKIIDNISFIHLDVEGMEYSAILGSENVIDKFNPIIAFEQHMDTDPVEEIIFFLNNKNYKIFIIDETLEGCRFDCKNLLALPSQMYNSELLKILNQNFDDDILYHIL
jgi:FkbM family methyltransferase